MPDAGGSSALDPMLCFAVYSLERRIGRVYAELLAPWGLTYTQYLVLTVLGANQDVPLTIGELGRLLDLDSGTLSPLVKRLEARGLVARHRATDDERVVMVSLTDDGHGLRTELADLQRCLAERMPGDPDEAQDLLRRLHAATARLPRLAGS
ncbi:MarR family transcriptional regulator [Isoptericola halotolerans]|uniref:DNA-binding MarR family transcriptional regulator n=1 Tax=Isoptericola halotolerans TaxID=300560 RepID=A0ABX2A8Y7_9MICO|nr:MarR family transcriptional regulator [Isoptericola halotolerans]NOV98098.1 DNA-binding MarR family transcriptional regulator [Isoptericola halotolerans]